MNLFKRIFSRKKKIKEPDDEQVPFEKILKQLYLEKGVKITLKQCSSDQFVKDFTGWNRGVGFNSYCSNNNSLFTCIKLVDGTANNEAEFKLLEDIPPIDNHFYKEESIRLQFLFSKDNSKDNRKDILYNIDSSVIYSVTDDDNREPVYFLIDKLTFNDFNKLPISSEKFIGDVKEKDEDLVFKIDKTDKFMAGRFFLPKIISHKPLLTGSEFSQIRITNNSKYYNNWIGLCFYINCQIEGKPYQFYYLFDLKSLDNINQYKSNFLKLLKIILKSNIINLKECGLTLSNIKVKAIGKPIPSDVIKSVQLSYNVKSATSIINGHIIIPSELISSLLIKIASSQSLLYASDSLKDRLRCFLSLNRELYSRGLLPIVEIDKAKLKVASLNPVQELRNNFIKLHDVLDLLSTSEAQNIVTNYLYRKGWSGRKLKRIFYCLKESESDDVKETIPLLFFNDDNFINYLMKNMKDEWQFTSDSGFHNFYEVAAEHFHVLRDLYYDNDFYKSVKLKAILTECFNYYYSQIDLLLQAIRNDKNYTNIQGTKSESLIKYFHNNSDVKYLFYYVPDHLKYFQSFLHQGQMEAISNLEIEPPEHKDDWLEHFIKFRNHFTAIS